MKVLSANCQGLQDIKKRCDVLSYLKEKNADIICLQDTHLVEKDYDNVKAIWGNNCIIHGVKTNSRGVAVLLNNSFDFEIIQIKKDSEGNFLQLVLKIGSMTLDLICIYAPNKDDPTFFDYLHECIACSKADHILVCGDFNLVLNPENDSLNYKNINNPRSRNCVLKIISELNMVDIYRKRYPKIRRYTWRKRKPLKQARLDFFLISSSMSDIITKCDIKAGYRSDHSAIEIDIILSNFVTHKGIWKFNNSLLKDKNYVELVNKVIQEEVIKYALPIYNLSFLENNSNFGNIQFSVEPDVFLEMVILRIRGESIKFSSFLKKERNKTENQLINDIEQLEQLSLDNNAYLDLLSDKKAELEKIREYKVRGEQVRSRIQWLNQGEKPTQFFCNLENRNFTDKTIRNIILQNGKMIFEQNEILNEVKNYYQNLFKSRDDKLDDINLETVIPNMKPAGKMDPHLGDQISISELGEILKNMKHNKSPGIDGITAEFLKVFWCKLKYFIVNTANWCFKMQSLPTSLQQCIITCLPKGNKDRRQIKNWRPISLLSVVYKLISGVIANRLKNVMDKVISNSQSGFIAGRQLSDNTRFIYDLMHKTEISNIPGLLVLIDFEKAFDSISWKFLYHVLEFFGFSKDFIKWIKLFNKNIIAYIVQCGKLSEKIYIGRGCRQGDPISAYLFLLAAEILAMLIKSNNDIKGIKIKKKEFKISQFADDTTLLLDGSQGSLQAALNTLETYGSYSGLKMNKEKQKLYGWAE